MDLRHLRYFAAVADWCHLGRAAEQSHIAQPALPHAIRRLDDDLNATLFTPTTKIELTMAWRGGSDNPVVDAAVEVLAAVLLPDEPALAAVKPQ